MDRKQIKQWLAAMKKMEDGDLLGMGTQAIEIFVERRLADEDARADELTASCIAFTRHVARIAEAVKRRSR